MADKFSQPKKNDTQPTAISKLADAYLTSGEPEASCEIPVLPGNKIVGIQDENFQVEVIRNRSLDAVHSLVSGRVPGLHYKGIASDQWCEDVAQRFIDHPETHKEKVVPAIYTIGKHLYACGTGTTVQCYFDELDKTSRVMKDILPDQHDPLISFLKEIAEHNGLEFEYLQADGKQVQHGTLRLWGRSEQEVGGTDDVFGDSTLKFFANPHEDLKETKSSHPMLSQIQECDNIYGVILCIKAVPGKEPRTILWDKELTFDQITNPDYRTTSGSYGFKTEILADSRVCALRLEPGDLGIIPGHKVHAVVGCESAERCTLSGFIHFIKDEGGIPTKMIFRT
ncbi:MAG: hypothetical protein ACK5GN_10030 [Pseudomonadota bacterium]|jgi:hypothetical protein